MLRAILNRLLTIVPSAVIGAMLIFGVVHLTPGGPAAAMLGPDASAEVMERLTRELGLDAPLYVQFGNWVGGIFQGDLGHSLLNRQPVVNLIADRLPYTTVLALEALVLALLIGVPLGVWAGIRRGSGLDTSIRTFSGLAFAFPEFWVGMMAMGIFALQLYWFPATGFVLPSQGLAAHINSAVLPVCTLAIGPIAIITRFTRSAMVEALAGHYVRTARALGLSPLQINWRFALKNALIPIVTVIGLVAGSLLGGAVLVERVFAIPGLGDLLTEAVLQKDFPVVQGTTAFLMIVVIVVNLLVDISVAILDPRTRIS